MHVTSIRRLPKARTGRKVRAPSASGASRSGRGDRELDAPPNASFGELTPLLAPRSVAVVGASDREGNLGGLAVSFLQKFGYRGPVWPVNAGRPTVGGLPCFPHLSALPALPDLVIIAVPAEAVIEIVQDCISVDAPAAIVWAGGFAEIGDSGRARRKQLEDTCRGARLTR